MDAKHTQGPVKFERYAKGFGIGQGNLWIAVNQNPDRATSQALAEAADFERIVACWNAMVGIDDPAAFVMRAKMLMREDDSVTELLANPAPPDPDVVAACDLLLKKNADAELQVKYAELRESHERLRADNERYRAALASITDVDPKNGYCLGDVMDVAHFALNPPLPTPAIVARCNNAEDVLSELRESHERLRSACELWDKGFVEGEEFTAEQFRKWVNDNRRAAREALSAVPT